MAAIFIRLSNYMESLSSAHFLHSVKHVEELQYNRNYNYKEESLIYKKITLFTGISRTNAVTLVWRSKVSFMPGKYCS